MVGVFRALRRAGSSVPGIANLFTPATFPISNGGGSSTERTEDTVMSGISILATEIRQQDGLFSLNDLHKASGGDKNQRPQMFLRNEQTRALVAEIENAQICAFRSRKGAGGGTYACKELVVAYGAWISPKLHLAVIQAFLSTQEQSPTSKELPKPANALRSPNGKSFRDRTDHESFGEKDCLQMIEDLQTMLQIIPQEPPEAISALCGVLDNRLTKVGHAVVGMSYELRSWAYINRQRA